MKIILTGIAAAALISVAAVAQTAPSGSMTPATPPAPMEPATTPPAADAGMAAPATGEGAMLTERDGKWYNGDREATTTEIAAYKKAKKAGRPS